MFRHLHVQNDYLKMYDQLQIPALQFYACISTFINASKHRCKSFSDSAFSNHHISLNVFKEFKMRLSRTRSALSWIWERHKEPNQVCTSIHFWPKIALRKAKAHYHQLKNSVLFGSCSTVNVPRSGVIMQDWLLVLAEHIPSGSSFLTLTENTVVFFAFNFDIHSCLRL
jgi:hypothetical protein